MGYSAGDYVAYIQFTVLLMPNGSDRITSHALQELKLTKSMDDPEIKAWLTLGTKTKKKGGGKKKKGNVGRRNIRSQSLRAAYCSNHYCKRMYDWIIEPGFLDKFQVRKATTNPMIQKRLSQWSRRRMGVHHRNE